MIMDDIPIFIGVRSSNHLYTTFALGTFFLKSPFRSFLRGAGSSFGSTKDQTEHHWGWDVDDIPIMDQFWDVAF